MRQSNLFSSSVVPFRIVFLMWLFFAVEYLYGWKLSIFGIVPRSIPGMIGIFMSPLLHGNVYHLISNTVPLLFLGSVLYFFYPRLAPTAFFRPYFWTNLLVWLFARPSILHIGASRIVYY